MKKSLAAIGIPFAVNVAVTVAFLAILPDQVPLHFGSSGEVDRIGSKYENLIFIAIAFGFGIFTALLARYGDKSNRITMARLGIGMQAIFILVGLFIFMNQLSYHGSSGSSNAPNLDMSQASTIVIGMTLIVMGNFMPKSTRNAAFGIRVSWTQKSDEAWQRAHRFGGYVSIAGGAAMVLSGVLLSGSTAFTALMAVFALWMLITLIGSYLLCKDLPD